MIQVNNSLKINEENMYIHPLLFINQRKKKMYKKTKKKTYISFKMPIKSSLTHIKLIFYSSSSSNNVVQNVKHAAVNRQYYSNIKYITWVCLYIYLYKYELNNNFFFIHCAYPSLLLLVSKNDLSISNYFLKIICVYKC